MRFYLGGKHVGARSLIPQKARKRVTFTRKIATQNVGLDEGAERGKACDAVFSNSLVLSTGKVYPR